MEKKKIRMKSLDDFDYNNKTVLLRLDINSPIDSKTKKIVNDNRIEKSLPTVNYLLEKNAKIVIIAHQGDTLDYSNLIPLQEHAQKLSLHLNTKVEYVDDVCGPYALEKVKNLKSGECVLLGNLRYLTEEVSTFENDVPLKSEQMKSTWLIRMLAPLCDIYVNDAFSAAHRNCPSMTGFQEVLPSCAGKLLFDEYFALSQVMSGKGSKNVFLLGGAKISDAFGMIKQVLEKGIADKILAGGITGQIMLIAKGYDIGQKQTQFLKDRSLDKFVEPAKEYLKDYPDKILYPLDLAYESEDKRKEIEIENLKGKNNIYLDIGPKTVELFSEEIRNAQTVFVNGPAGVYENKLFEYGTNELFKALVETSAYTVIGGGDTVSAGKKFINLKDIDYVCTAGGAMVRFLSGKKLPLIEAMEKSYDK